MTTDGRTPIVMRARPAADSHSARPAQAIAAILSVGVIVALGAISILRLDQDVPAREGEPEMIRVVVSGDRPVEDLLADAEVRSTIGDIEAVLADQGVEAFASPVTLTEVLHDLYVRDAPSRWFEDALLRTVDPDVISSIETVASAESAHSAGIAPDLDDPDWVTVLVRNPDGVVRPQLATLLPDDHVLQIIGLVPPGIDAGEVHEALEEAADEADRASTEPTVVVVGGDPAIRAELGSGAGRALLWAVLGAVGLAGVWAVVVSSRRIGSRKAVDDEQSGLPNAKTTALAVIAGAFGVLALGTIAMADLSRSTEPTDWTGSSGDPARSAQLTSTVGDLRVVLTTPDGILDLTGIEAVDRIGRLDLDGAAFGLTTIISGQTGAVPGPSDLEELLEVIRSDGEHPNRRALEQLLMVGGGDESCSSAGRTCTLNEALTITAEQIRMILLTGPGEPSDLDAQQADLAATAADANMTSELRGSAVRRSERVGSAMWPPAVMAFAVLGPVAAWALARTRRFAGMLAFTAPSAAGIGVMLLVVRVLEPAVATVGVPLVIAAGIAGASTAAVVAVVVVPAALSLGWPNGRPPMDIDEDRPLFG